MPRAFFFILLTTAVIHAFDCEYGRLSSALLHQNNCLVKNDTDLPASGLEKALDLYVRGSDFEQEFLLTGIGQAFMQDELQKFVATNFTGAKYTTDLSSQDMSAIYSAVFANTYRFDWKKGGLPIRKPNRDVFRRILVTLGSPQEE